MMFMPKLILKKYVPNLGNEGDVVTVKDGYARNFLLPRKMAVLAKGDALKVVEQEKRGRDARLLKEQSDARALAEKLSAAAVQISKRADEDGTLYGAVSPTEIVHALVSAGFPKFNPDSIHIHSPLKKVGDHAVEVVLAKGVTAELKVAVQAAV